MSPGDNPAPRTALGISTTSYADALRNPKPVECAEHKFAAWDYAEQVQGNFDFIQKRHCTVCRYAEIRRITY